MKPIFPLGYTLVILTLLSSCVSTKKFNLLKDEKLKIETTLLGTKQKLSDAKLELNKYKDASSDTHASNSETIASLKAQLAENQKALTAAQSAVVDCQNQLQQANNQLKNVSKNSQQQLSPFLEVQKNLRQQNQSLRAIDTDIKNLLAANPLIKMTTLLHQDELKLTFDFGYLFSSSGRSISTEGREGLHQLVEVLKRYPSVYIDINGHVAPKAGGDARENWKNSTRRTLSVLYTLLQKEISPNKIRVIGYGEYNPIANNDTPEGALQNNRAEIILRYQNTQLLKLIPLK